MNIKPSQFPARLRRLSRRGQTLVEYALIISFVSVVAIATLFATGSQIQTAFTTIDTQLNKAENGGATASARTH